MSFTTGTKKHRIVALIKASGKQGITCDEAEEITGWTHQSVSPIFTRLYQDDYIVHAGHNRRTRSKVMATAWKWS